MKFLKLTKFYAKNETAEVFINLDKITHINRGATTFHVYIGNDKPIEVTENVEEIMSKINDLINN